MKCMTSNLLIHLSAVFCLLFVSFLQHKTIRLTNENENYIISCILNFPTRSQEGVGPVAADRKSLTLPVSRNRTGILHARLQQLGTLESAHTINNSKPDQQELKNDIRFEDKFIC